MEKSVDYLWAGDERGGLKMDTYFEERMSKQIDYRDRLRFYSNLHSDPYYWHWIAEQCAFICPLKDRGRQMSEHDFRLFATAGNFQSSNENPCISERY